MYDSAIDRDPLRAEGLREMKLWFTPRAVEVRAADRARWSPSSRRYVPSTATATGPLTPVMKLWFTPVPSRFARPIEVAPGALFALSLPQ